jgi:hypothetical protein
MRVKGQEQVAQMFGVAPKTITEWQVLGFPVAVQGGPGIASEYDAPACVRWYVDREVAKVCNETPKDRLNRLQGNKLEREELKELGLLVPAEEVEPAWNNAVLLAREFLQAEPARLALLMIGKDKDTMQQMLLEAFESFLTKLSTLEPDDLPLDGDDAADEEDALGDDE